MKVVLGGIVKNIESNIASIFKFIFQLKQIKMFKHIKIVIRKKKERGKSSIQRKLRTY